jgi:hypothetical protein
MDDSIIRILVNKASTQEVVEKVLTILTVIEDHLNDKCEHCAAMLKQLK